METSKRKHAEDIYFQQSKKLRVDHHDGDLSINRQVCPQGASENNPLVSSSIEVEMPDGLPSSCSSAERAIVVYKPNPELFLSNPIPRAPRVQLDRRIFTPGMLGPNSLLAADAHQQLGVVRTNPVGPDLGPTFGMPLKGVPENRFAVVPWVASSPNMPATGLSYRLANETRASQSWSKAVKEDEVMGESALESQAMDEDVVTEIQSLPPSTPITKFATEPWQQYGVPQPQFGSVT